jgi:FkbM family methyltransferase
MTTISHLDWFFSFSGKCRRLVCYLARRFLGTAPRVETGPGKGLRLDIGGTTELFLQGKYEGPVQEVVSRMLDTGNVFFDIGANIGFFSLLAARIVGPTGAVYAFEPVAENVSVAKKNARLNNLDNLKVFTLAMASRTGKEELLLARYAGGAVLKGAGIPPDLSGSLMVETSTVDDFLLGQKVRPPDIVKIDVEGAELDVLHGMVDTLRNRGPKLIIEVDDGNESKCEEKLRSCREFISGFGYRTELLPNSYKDGHWFVRHIVAQR